MSNYSAKPRRSIVPALAGIAVVLVGLVFLGGFVIALNLKGAALKKKGEASTANLKQIATAVAIYVQEYDQYLPPMASMGQMKAAIAAYTKDQSISTNPLTDEFYESNPNLSLLPRSQITNPASTILVREAEPDATGNRRIAFVDGTVKRFAEAQWKTLLLGEPLNKFGK